MLIDYRNPHSALETELLFGRVLVDGAEVALVYFIDTEAGYVETYDVDDTHRPVFDGIDGVKSRKVHGSIQLFRKDGTQL